MMVEIGFAKGMIGEDAGSMVDGCTSMIYEVRLEMTIIILRVPVPSLAFGSRFRERNNCIVGSHLRRKKFKYRSETQGKFG